MQVVSVFELLSYDCAQCLKEYRCTMLLNLYRRIEAGETCKPYDSIVHEYV